MSITYDQILAFAIAMEALKKAREGKKYNQIKIIEHAPERKRTFGDKVIESEYIEFEEL